MAKESVDQPAFLMEVEKLPRPSDRADRGVKKLHHLPERSLQQAKAAFGKAVKVARGPHPMKVFGAENTMSAVESGDKVPDYMARIYQDDGARRRFARELLKGAEGVRTRNVTVIEWDEEAG